MEDRLTPQQAKLVRNLIKGMTLTDAALKAGYTDKSPGQAGYQAMKTIRLKMPQIMEKQGLRDQKLIKKYLKPALEATKTEFFQRDGHVIETAEVIAWDTRLRALDMAFKLKGSYAPVETESHHVHEVSVIEQVTAKKSLEKIAALSSQEENPLIAEHVEDDSYPQTS